MNRTMIAALTLLGAASFAAAPALAQNALFDAKIPHEAEPPSSGVAPSVSPIAGAKKGSATQQATSSPTSSGAVPKLMLAPEKK